MNFIKVAVTSYESDGARPAIGADDMWINLDLVVSIQEHLGSNSFDRSVRAGVIAVEHYPCVQLTTANGEKHLIPLGTFPDQRSGMDALARFMPLLLTPTFELR